MTLGKFGRRPPAAGPDRRPLLLANVPALKRSKKPEWNARSISYRSSKFFSKNRFAVLGNKLSRRQGDAGFSGATDTLLGLRNRSPNLRRTGSTSPETLPNGFGQLLGKTQHGSKNSLFILSRSSYVLHLNRKFHPAFGGLHTNAVNQFSGRMLFDLRHVDASHALPLMGFIGVDTLAQVDRRPRLI